MKLGQSDEAVAPCSTLDGVEYGAGQRGETSWLLQVHSREGGWQRVVATALGKQSGCRKRGRG
jgi:hypothetical protein